MAGSGFGEFSAGEYDYGGYAGVLEALIEDFLAAEPGGTCKDKLHFVGWGAWKCRKNNKR